VPPAADKWVGERTAPSATSSKSSAPAGPIKRLTIDLELDKHTRFKVLCAGKGLKMADEIRTLIERRIAELEGHREGQGRRH